MSQAPVTRDPAQEVPAKLPWPHLCCEGKRPERCAGSGLRTQTRTELLQREHLAGPERGPRAGGERVLGTKHGGVGE